jgi:hypothetical protein
MAADGLLGRSEPQCLHFVASSLIDSAQNGHLRPPLAWAGLAAAKTKAIKGLASAAKKKNPIPFRPRPSAKIATATQNANHETAKISIPIINDPYGNEGEVRKDF